MGGLWSYSLAYTRIGTGQGQGLDAHLLALEFREGRWIDGKSIKSFLAYRSMTEEQRQKPSDTVLLIGMILRGGGAL